MICFSSDLGVYIVNLNINLIKINVQLAFYINYKQYRFSTSALINEY